MPCHALPLYDVAGCLDGSLQVQANPSPSMTGYTNVLQYPGQLAVNTPETSVLAKQNTLRVALGSFSTAASRIISTTTETIKYLWLDYWPVLFWAVLTLVLTSAMVYGIVAHDEQFISECMADGHMRYYCEALLNGGGSVIVQAAGR